MYFRDRKIEISGFKVMDRGFSGFLSLPRGKESWSLAAKSPFFSNFYIAIGKNAFPVNFAAQGAGCPSSAWNI